MEGGKRAPACASKTGFLTIKSRDLGTICRQGCGPPGSSLGAVQGSGGARDGECQGVRRLNWPLAVD